MRAHLAHTLLLLLSFATTACITLGGPREGPSQGYAFDAPAAPWTPLDPGTADHVYRHPEAGSVLGVGSSCGPTSQQSLEDLTTNALVGLTADAVHRQEPATVAGHPALASDLDAVMDGRPVRVLLTVVRAGACVYDVLLVTPGREQPAVAARAHAAVVGSLRPETAR